MGGATLENVQVPFHAISTGDLIRQQHLSRLYPNCTLTVAPVEGELNAYTVTWEEKGK